MESNKNIKKYSIMGIVAMLLLLVVIVVNYENSESEQKNKKQNVVNTEGLDKRISVRMEESSLLLNISKLNLKIITLSDLEIEEDNDYWAIKIANNLMTDHNKIKSLLNQIASKKLISIPDKLFTKEMKDVNNIDLNNLPDEYLDRVSVLLGKEISQVEHLLEITTDVDFKALASEILPILKNDLDQLNQNNTNINHLKNQKL